MAFKIMPLLFAFLLLATKANSKVESALGSSKDKAYSRPPLPPKAVKDKVPASASSVPKPPTTPYPPRKTAPPPPPLPAEVPTPPPAVKAPPSSPPPQPRNKKECIPLCMVRCKSHSRQNVCLRACTSCCERCRCVPPGQYGNKEKCGKCYTDMTTHGGLIKCP